LNTDLFDAYSDEIMLREDANAIARMDELAALYEGTIPAKYAEYFPKNTPQHKVNLVRLAQDDLATTVGRIPDLRGQVTNNSRAELQRVGKLEKIGHSYLHNAEPTGKMFMWQYAWWLLNGRAVAIVVPDHEEKKPSIEIRDPRTCYPGPAKTAGGQIVKLNDLMFKYELDAQEMKARGLAVKKVRSSGPFGRMKDANTGVVIEYIDKEYWVIASDGGTVQRVRHGLGVVPGIFSHSFSPNQIGLSQFEDQVSFMVAISLMLSMKMAYMERIVYPVTWVRGHQGNIKIGPHVINKLGPGGEMGQLAPTAQVQVDRDISTLERYSRLLNKNPEVRSGEVQQKGTYVGAKTLEQLNEAVDTVVGRYWDIIGSDLQKLLLICMEMDKQYWGDEEKSISGIKKGQGYLDKYTPNKDIGDKTFLRVDYGFGVGGYQGFLQNVQAFESKLLPKRRAIEEMPGISDVDQVLRELELEQMDEVGHALWLTQAQQGSMDPIIWAKVRKDMAEKGWSMNETMLKYTEELEKRAQAAQQAGAASALETAAAPPPGGQPTEEAPPPGLNPAAVA
jgi:hypothetical protein